MKPDSHSLGQLLILAAQGNHACFADIYKRTHTHLIGDAVCILDQDQVAEDAKLLAKVSKLIATVQTDAAPVTPGNNVFFGGNCAKLW